MHPNSQRQLVNMFSNAKMQRIITTHSPYILSSVELNALVHVSLNQTLSKFYCFSDLQLGDEELRKIRQAVLDSKGELFFSKIVILVEGLTESESLPIFIKEYFNREIFEMGITIIAVDGTNYVPFLRVLQYAEIECYIFSDGDVENKLNKAREYLPENNIIIIDDGDNYEKHLIKSGYSREIEKAINEYEEPTRGRGQVAFVDEYIKDKDGQKKKGGKGVRDYSSEEGRKIAILDIISEGKAKYSAAVAKKICSCNDGCKYPPKIKELLDKLQGYMEYSI